MLSGVTELCKPLTSILFMCFLSSQHSLPYCFSSFRIFFCSASLSPILTPVTNFKTLFLLTLFLFLYSHFIQYNFMVFTQAGFSSVSHHDSLGSRFSVGKPTRHRTLSVSLHFSVSDSLMWRKLFPKDLLALRHCQTSAAVTPTLCGRYCHPTLKDEELDFAETTQLINGSCRTWTQ